MQFLGDWAELVRDCVSGAGALFFWGLATIVACFVFKAVFNTLGWITERAFQLTGRAYAGETPYRPG